MRISQRACTTLITAIAGSRIAAWLPIVLRWFRGALLLVEGNQHQTFALPTAVRAFEVMDNTEQASIYQRLQYGVVGLLCIWIPSVLAKPVVKRVWFGVVVEKGLLLALHYVIVT